MQTGAWFKIITNYLKNIKYWRKYKMNNDPVIKTFIPYGKQYIDEDDIVAVSEVLRGAYITTGPRVEIFERDLCNLTGGQVCRRYSKRYCGAARGLFCSGNRRR